MQVCGSEGMVVRWAGTLLHLSVGFFYFYFLICTSISFRFFRLTPNGCACVLCGIDRLSYQSTANKV